MDRQQLISKGIGLTTSVISVPTMFEIFNEVAARIDNPDATTFEVGLVSIIIGAYGAYRLGERLTNYFMDQRVQHNPQHAVRRGWHEQGNFPPFP